MQSQRADFERPGQIPQRNVFFALLPDESAIDSIVAAVDNIATANRSMGRRLRRQRLHMTLLYLDALAMIPAPFLRHAIDAGDHITAAPFDMVLDTAGSFPNNDVAWWLGCSTPPTALSALHETLYRAMRLRGERPRRGKSFAPHVTISRSNGEELAKASINPICWRVDTVYLIDSLVAKKEFDIVKKWKLIGSSDG